MLSAVVAATVITHATITLQLLPGLWTRPHFGGTKDGNEMRKPRKNKIFRIFSLVENIIAVVFTSRNSETKHFVFRIFTSGFSSTALVITNTTNSKRGTGIHGDTMMASGWRRRWRAQDATCRIPSPISPESNTCILRNTALYAVHPAAVVLETPSQPGSLPGPLHPRLLPTTPQHPQPLHLSL